MNECDFIIPQKVPNGFSNSYWTLAVKYEGENTFSVGNFTHNIPHIDRFDFEFNSQY